MNIRIYPLRCLTISVAVCFLPASLASASLSEWHAAIGNTDIGESAFVAVETDTASVAPKVYIAGNSKNNFQFGGLPNLTLPKKSTGIVVGATQAAGGSGIDANWLAIAFPGETLTLTDLTVIPNSNLIAVCGSFGRLVKFQDWILQTDGSYSKTDAFTIHPTVYGTYGFFALLDATTGAWSAAHLTDGILPNSITCDASNSVIVTGTGALAARYSTDDGALIWKTTAPTGVFTGSQVSSSIGAPLVVLASLIDSTPTQPVSLYRLDPATGAVQWNQRMGSDASNMPGGLQVSPAGGIRLAFRSNFNTTSFGGVPVELPTVVAGDALFAASVTGAGALEWIAPAATPAGLSARSITCTDLAISPNGGFWLACTASGTWSFGNHRDITLDNDVLTIQVDPLGAVEQILRAATGNNSNGAAKAVAVAANGNVFVAGDFQGTGTAGFPPLAGLNLHIDSLGGAFLAMIDPVEQQQLFVAELDPAGNLTLSELRDLVVAASGSVYAEFGEGEIVGGSRSLSFWASPEAAATINADPRINVVVDFPMLPSGTTVNPGWALQRISAGYSSGTGDFIHPDTATPVRLYLIDTAVSNTGGWMQRNANLTFEQTVLIRGTGDLAVSSSFKHGTQMLSLIGGKDTGAAPGTPIHVVNYDIYPSGGTTTTSLLAKAIIEAVIYHRNSPNPMPSAICIATSSATEATSYTLRTAVDMAVAEGIPVIVSAGNLGEDASKHIPAAYGTTPGVICTGASDPSDNALSISNYGPPVDLLAPGLSIPTVSTDSTTGFENMTGTSPAAAFTAATTLIEMSANGQRTPATIEERLKSAADKTALTPLLRISVTPAEILAEQAAGPADGPIIPSDSPTSLEFDPLLITIGTHTVIPDADADGIPDILEIFYGSDPELSAVLPANPVLESSADGQNRYSFPVSRELFDSSNPFTLRNGTVWRITSSTDLSTWAAPIGSLEAFTASDGQLWITATFPVSAPRCFARLELYTAATN